MNARGVTLVELMIAMVVGLLLVTAAIAIYAQSRSTSRVNENVARLQEQGRYALSVIEPDIELAGLYGFTNLPETARLISGGNPSVIVAAADQMRQFPWRPGDPLPTAVVGLPPGAHACGVNFAVDVSTPVQGSNNVFDMGRARTGCNPYSSGAQAGADTLTIRRAETEPSAPESSRLQIYASRFTSRTAQLLFVDGNAPGVVDTDHRIHNFVVRTYYIARDSVNRTAFPALRVKSLSRSGVNLVFDEDEVIPGVEDLQIQFGIDTGDYNNDGVIDTAADPDRDGIVDPNGRATRYVNPDFPDLPRYQVAAVRIWLRIRAEESEVGFIDDRTYRYADVVYTPSGGARNFRRALMSRTVAVRNARMY